ncbi:MAG TPA: response regulator transcription factor [Ideonella sp.]|uniref:response regulator transcription factor n=1 Tax=Ideonella sp. TaxID=1929293 RepID=UPI002CB5886B|nr:response regulator transcription factor [Ideonella sp.]HSI49479.1 response regulator transcription factor [Ideonella sp.]
MSLITPTVVQLHHENAVVEAGLRQLLGAWSDFDVQPPASEGHMASPQPSVPDLLVVDHDSGVRWALNHRLDPVAHTKVMIVSMRGQEADVQRALEAGVRGYVLIGGSADEVVSAARAVAAGRRYLCTTATHRMADGLARPTLTRRESEVLAFVFRGRNNKEVARSLGISVGTVKSHVRALLGKLDARCRTEAVWIASQCGLVGAVDLRPISTRPHGGSAVAATQ